MPLIASNPKPRIILGLMNYGPDPSAGARITSLETYNTILDHFQAAGYNEVDTARTYVGGKQEAFTREARWQERGLTLATKVYPKEKGWHTEKELTERFETSLRELGTDCVDIFYLHAAVCTSFSSLVSQLIAKYRYRYKETEANPPSPPGPRNTLHRNPSSSG